MWSVVISEYFVSHRYIIFASIRFLILQAGAHLYYIPGVVDYCKMTHVVPLVLFICLFPSKNFMTILVDRSDSFPYEKIKIIFLLFSQQHTYVKRNCLFIQPPKRDRKAFQIQKKTFEFCKYIKSNYQQLNRI